MEMEIIIFLVSFFIVFRLLRWNRSGIEKAIEDISRPTEKAGTIFGTIISSIIIAFIITFIICHFLGKF